MWSQPNLGGFGSKQTMGLRAGCSCQSQRKRHASTTQVTPGVMCGLFSNSGRTRVTESPIWPAQGEPQPLSEQPERSAGDYAHSVVKAALGLIPLAGGPLSEAFDVAIGTPLDRRREDWIRRIGEGLEELQQRFKGFDPARLAENEAFV